MLVVHFRGKKKLGNMGRKAIALTTYPNKLQGSDMSSCPYFKIIINHIRP
jgi:hypothetical protein